MEKTMRPERIPETDSIEELAKFWDTHDLTDFEDQLEEVTEPIFVRGNAATVVIKLKPTEVRTLRGIAESEGVNEATLVRQWVLEKLRKTSSRAKPPKTALQPTARKTRRG